MSVGHIFRTTENGPLNDTAVKRAQDRHHAHLRGMDRGIDGLAPRTPGKLSAGFRWQMSHSERAETPAIRHPFVAPPKGASQNAREALIRPRHRAAHRARARCGRRGLPALE
jgi:hypothetical protein